MTDGLVDPQELAALPRPLLIATDVDGTLSPLVARPELAHLAGGAIDALEALLAHDGVHVAVVSGRAYVELVDQFGLPASLHLVGSHGAEFGQRVDLSGVDAARLEEVRGVLQRIAGETPGALIESKPLAAALHVRNVEAAAVPGLLAAARAAFAEREGVSVHDGHLVVEVSVVRSTKVEAIARLCRVVHAAGLLFIGDDESDEEVFRAIDDGVGALGLTAGAAIGIKVGPGSTVAARRLPDPSAVVALLHALSGAL